jgi:hypothetical protein
MILKVTVAVSEIRKYALNNMTGLSNNLLSKAGAVTSNPTWL